MIYSVSEINCLPVSGVKMPVYFRIQSNDIRVKRSFLSFFTVSKAFKTNSINYLKTEDSLKQCLFKYGTQATPIQIIQTAHYANPQAPSKRGTHQNL